MLQKKPGLRRLRLPPPGGETGGYGTCAFFGLNGYDIYDKERKKKLSWFTALRCRGYVFDPSREARRGVCCDYLSIDQWAAINRTPVTDGLRIAAWDGFKRENLEKQNSSR